MPRRFRTAARGPQPARGGHAKETNPLDTEGTARQSRNRRGGFPTAQERSVNRPAAFGKPPFRRSAKCTQAATIHFGHEKAQKVAKKDLCFFVRFRASLWPIIWDRSGLRRHCAELSVTFCSNISVLCVLCVPWRQKFRRIGREGAQGTQRKGGGVVLMELGRFENGFDSPGCGCAELRPLCPKD